MCFVLASARIGGAISICPALTDGMIPGLLRKAIVVSFAAIVVPHVMLNMPDTTLAFPLVFIVLKEVLIGFLIGFFAAIPFWIAENIGNIIDNQRGSTMGEVYSPLSGTQVSTTGILFTQITSTVFFVSGAVLLLLGAIYKSYDIWPMFDYFKGFEKGAPLYILEVGDSMIRTTAVIAAPIIIVMFLATIGLGFVNRTAPQLNVFFLSMPIKSALGIFMLIIYLQYIMDMLMYSGDSAIIEPLKKVLIE